MQNKKIPNLLSIKEKQVVINKQVLNVNLNKIYLYIKLFLVIIKNIIKLKNYCISKFKDINDLKKKFNEYKKNDQSILF